MKFIKFIFISKIVFLLFLGSACRAEQGEASLVRNAKNSMQTLMTGLITYKWDYDKLPSGKTIEILKELLRIYGDDQPFFQAHRAMIEKGVGILDPWGIPYEIFISSKDEIFIISSGPDKDFASEKRIILYRKAMPISQTPKAADLLRI